MIFKALREALSQRLDRWTGMALARQMRNRHLQYEVDTFRILTTLAVKKWHGDVKEFSKLFGEKISEAASLSKEQEFLAELRELPFQKQQQLVDTLLQEQVTDLFEAMEATLGSTESGFDGQMDVGRLQETAGFVLEKAPSVISGAGTGVLARGKISIGTVVTVYPGTVYLPWHLRDPRGLEHLFNNCYVMSRFDNAAIDGEPLLQTPELERRGVIEKRKALLGSHDSEHSAVLERAKTATVWQHPYALGHLINHPAREMRPNVLGSKFDFPLTFPQHLRKFIPNSYYKPPFPGMDDECLIKSIVLVATKDIEDGEELLLNYRLNPSVPNLPEWYESVDNEEDRRRWAK